MASASWRTKVYIVPRKMAHIFQYPCAKVCHFNEKPKEQKGNYSPPTPLYK